MKHEARAAIIAGLAANIGIAATKFVAAAHSGSSAMLAEGMHSLVDCADSCLLWYGIRRANRPADATHPVGHGREIYFWALIVALLFFSLGGGMSFYEGGRRILHPQPMGNLGWSFGVLGVSALFTLGSFTVALRGFRARTMGRSYWTTFRQSTDPTFFTLVLEDAADLAGVLVAAVGIACSEWLGKPALDGVASMVIGGVMTTVAILLARESKSLLIGESVRPTELKAITAAARQEHAVLDVRRPLTLVLGPDSVLVAMDVEFRPELTARDVTTAIERLEGAIHREAPSVQHIYIEASSVKEAVRTAH